MEKLWQVVLLPFLMWQVWNERRTQQREDILDAAHRGEPWAMQLLLKTGEISQKNFPQKPGTEG